MMAQKTTFVVGAGASKEFGLPTGRELLEIISNLVYLESDDRGSRHRFCSPELQKVFEQAGRSHSEFGGHNDAYIKLINEAVWICKVCRLAPSIDNLLHAHSENLVRVVAGKILLAFAILDAEKRSSLYRKNDTHFLSFFFNEKNIGTINERAILSPTKSWLAELFWTLVEQRTKEDFVNSLRRIRFICFNYDRCIEHFLVNASALYFDLTAKETLDVFESISIVHPYGSLGDLVVEDRRAIGFGDSNIGVAEIAKNINTFTEGGRFLDLDDQLNKSLSETSQLVFLGFGFLPLNMDLVFKKTYGIAFISGTAKGLSVNSKGLVRKHLAEKVRYGTKDESYRAMVLGGVDFRNDNHLAELELSDTTCMEFMQRNKHLLNQT